MATKQNWKTIGKISFAVILLTMSGIIFSKILTEGTLPAPALAAPTPSAPKGYFHTPFQTESQFIVETVATDLAQMFVRASSSQPRTDKNLAVTSRELAGPTWQNPVYEVKIAGLPSIPEILLRLPVNGPIWAPETYKPLTLALQKAFPTSTPEAVASLSDISLLLTLSDLKPAVLERENQRLSAKLDADFTNATLHSQAAVLLGAFGFRENSGTFHDVRHTLCRMAAHLAFAEALNAQVKEGINWRYANIMQLTLMNNRAAALEALDQTKQAPITVRGWDAALAARNTGDYRPFEAHNPETRLELVEYFRSLCLSLHPVVAFERLKGSSLWDTPDPYWAIYSDDFSVGLGHQALAHALKAQMIEIASVYQLARGKTFPAADIAKILNIPPGLAVAGPDREQGNVQIIDWGQWAMQFQRQLGHIVVNDYNFLKNRWGVPEYADKYRLQVEKFFTGLRLFPFVARTISNSVPMYHRAVDAAFPVTVETPHLVGPGIWNQLCYTVNFAPLYLPNPNPHINEWHNHNPPPQTAYNPLPRFNQPSLTKRPDCLAAVEKMHALAPYDENICHNLMRLTSPGAPSTNLIERVCEKLLPFSAWANFTLANSLKSDPIAYDAAMNRAAAIRPSYYYELSDYWHERGDEEKRVAYAEKGIEMWPEDLAAAKASAWLAQYYLKKGDLARAEKLSQMGAEVYSFAGLQGAGQLKEAQAKFPEAEEFYKKIKDRYKDPTPLTVFYHRQFLRTGEAEFDRKFQTELKAFFPAGLKTTILGDFSGPPKSGVTIGEENSETAKAGLKHGDIVVSLDGYRTENCAQYTFIRQMKEEDASLHLIVWQGGRYIEIVANPPKRLFGISLSDFSSP